MKIGTCNNYDQVVSSTQMTWTITAVVTSPASPVELPNPSLPPVFDNHSTMMTPPPSPTVIELVTCPVNRITMSASVFNLMELHKKSHGQYARYAYYALCPGKSLNLSPSNIRIGSSMCCKTTPDNKCTGCLASRALGMLARPLHDWFPRSRMTCMDVVEMVGNHASITISLRQTLAQCPHQVAY